VAHCSKLHRSVKLHCQMDPRFPDSGRRGMGRMWTSAEHKTKSNPLPARRRHPSARCGRAQSLLRDCFQPAAQVSPGSHTSRRSHAHLACSQLMPGWLVYGLFTMAASARPFRAASGKGGPGASRRALSQRRKRFRQLRNIEQATHAARTSIANARTCTTNNHLSKKLPSLASSSSS